MFFRESTGSTAGRVHAMERRYFGNARLRRPARKAVGQGVASTISHNETFVPLHVEDGLTHGFGLSHTELDPPYGRGIISVDAV